MTEEGFEQKETKVTKDSQRAGSVSDRSTQAELCPTWKTSAL
jgi:hypothetical protein